MSSLSLSSTLSPHFLPQTPSSSSLKFRQSFSKSPFFKPNFHISSPTLRSTTPQSSLQLQSTTLNSPSFQPINLGLDDIGLGPIMGSATQTPETSMRGAEADVMGLLLKERIVFLGSGIDDFVADAIISQLLLLDAQDHTKDIRLFINSPGGSLSATMAIFDVVRLVRADVSTLALGIAASTASIILGAGTKGKRLAMPNARIMVHQPLGGASGQAIDVEIQAREIMHNKNNITRIISEFTGRPFEEIEKDIDRDRYMSPIEAVEYGLIDGVIDRDSIIPLEPVPDKVKSTFNYMEISKDPKKYLTPEIPDDEIY
ncbi:hypothetical protein BVRB_5g107950 [Beta vulgaris subsp. vulgaris]|uniref:ATP-dependent Clp protease proteolytic subunit 4, chloroplastic n=1 Tax=Beta vulgaris subsp. vulgaris TaxID=3555 RepID=UPI00053FE6A8|nr:ATP-dependent Clp protease proteolytic subunit 4, chloroplastic [Beta vulgaris subsp. vulgaris]XP_010677486.1 ATP-dependent Clp protease proteolytic subunit 4, chloroplastic [Beta vulgaris subsp. vulgaris]XP_048500668.1 ATP-dependent Clp protease proteolytic subunit 4, chloroplastic [Beta vulgaris subsp. vulgaris]KMT11470.1 hypothetical protein BVRB_5g107950 [Beta vulgaris subsp. vulgaris]